MTTVWSSKDLENVFQNMATSFDGKETEENWKKRDNYCSDLGKIAQGNSPKEFHQTFFVGVKSILSGILTCAISERTTLSNHGCELLRVLVKVMGASTHSLLDILFPPLIQLSGSTKVVSQKAASETIEAIILYAQIYSPRLLYHVSTAFYDKKTPPRMYAAFWIKSLVQLFFHQMEQTGGLDTVDKCLSIGLTDAQVKVREASRPAYWLYSQSSPKRALDILSTLNAHNQKALQEDPSNPNKPEKQASKAAQQANKSVRSTGIAELRAKAKKSLLELNQKAAQDAMEPPSRTIHPQKSFQPREPLQRPKQEQTEGVNTQSQPRRPHPAKEHSSRQRPEHAEPPISTSQPREISEEESSHHRPLLSAPVRRIRVVSNQSSNPGIHSNRPPSRGEGRTRHEIPASGINSHSSREPLTLTNTQQPVSIPAESPKSTLPYVQQETTVAEKRGRRREPMAEIEVQKLQRERPPVNEKVDISEKTKVPPETAHTGSPQRQEPHELDKLKEGLRRRIQDIRDNALDSFGYHRIQRLLETEGMAPFQRDEKLFRDLLSSLLTAYSRVDPNTLDDDITDSSSSRKPAPIRVAINDSRPQILSILKLMFEGAPKAAKAFHSEGLSLALKARGDLKDHDYSVALLEELLDVIVTTAHPLPLIETTLDVLDSVSNTTAAAAATTTTTTTTTGHSSSTEPSAPPAPPLPSREAPRISAIALQTLSKLLARLRSLGVDDDLSVHHPALELRLVDTAARNLLSNHNPRVKQATVGLCLALHKIMLPEDRFFAAVARGQEGCVNLLSYYIVQEKV